LRSTTGEGGGEKEQEEESGRRPRKIVANQPSLAALALIFNPVTVKEWTPPKIDKTSSSSLEVAF
jgi:hypothetical protein